jgi:16S rRNA (cytidine1402-2'-O)-methyltransferase
VLGPPVAVASDDADAAPAGLDALRRLVDAGAHPRKAAGVVAELTGSKANALYRALTSGAGPDPPI